MSFRIDGLVSGLDTGAIIEQMMAIERLPIANMQKKQQQLEQQKNAWRDINTRMRSLVDKFTSLKLESTYLGRTATSSEESILRANASSSAVEGTYQVVVKQLATAAVRYSEKRVEDIDAPLGAGTLTFELGNGQTVDIEVAAEWSLRDLVNHINALRMGDDDAAHPFAVKASIVDNRLVLTSREMGVENRFIVSSVSEGLGGAFGSFLDVEGSGQDAELEINGITSIKSSSNTLEDVIQGVTLELLEVGTTTVTVSQDTQQVINRLQEFVDQYNSVISFINDKLQAQSAMDSSSIRGTLSGDSTLLRLQSTLRSIVASGTGGDGKYSTLSQIGISTAKFVAGAADYSGKLTLDKAKLEEALKEDPLAVKELLFKVTELEEGDETVTENSGILHNLEEYVRTFTRAGDGILTAKDKSYDEQIKDLKQQVERMEQRLEIRQERLSAQFVALEKVLASMQTQGDWLSAQLVQLNNMYNQPRNR
jgi:flagellar hook-associated protein 2